MPGGGSKVKKEEIDSEDPKPDAVPADDQTKQQVAERSWLVDGTKTWDKGDDLVTGLFKGLPG